MDSTNGHGRAVITEDDVEFDARDATLFRAIARTGSVAAASSDLGRSRARVLTRIEALEEAFGDLVERRRGGTGGGGSQLTENAIRLLNRHDRLQAAVTATTRAPETVLQGVITTVSGELATAETDVGSIHGLHDGIRRDTEIQVRIGGDAITVLDPTVDMKSEATSARNSLSGEVSDIDHGETVATVDIDVRGTMFRVFVTENSVTRLGLQKGRDVVLTWKATATRLVSNTTL